VTENDKVTTQARHKQSRGKQRSKTERMRMLRAAADRSTCVWRRQEKLCRQWLTDAYGGRPVMKMALNEGALGQSCSLHQKEFLARGGHVRAVNCLTLKRVVFSSTDCQVAL